MMNWEPITKLAKGAAKELGHDVRVFEKPQRRTPSVWMASCRKCDGCCWVAQKHDGGLSAGGRVLKYKCGTKEALGVL